MSFEQIKQTSKQKTSLRKELYISRIWHLHEHGKGQERSDVTVERTQCQQQETKRNLLTSPHQSLSPSLNEQETVNVCP